MNRLGAPRAHFRRTSSTNERARELADAGAPHGTLVTAREQTAGRGRHGRAWWAPAGGSLLMSLVLRDPPTLLPVSAALAVCDAVEAGARIKWPNDIVLERGDDADGAPGLTKLAGILIESRPPASAVVLGIGINAAVRAADVPDELSDRVASLNQPVAAIEPLLERLLVALAARLGEQPEETLRAWRERDALYGRRIGWSEGARSSRGADHANEGRAEGIDGAGRLIVKRDDGARVTLSAGEVHLLDPSVRDR